MLYRLIYASESTPAFANSEVNALLAQARLNNGLRDMTGMLVFDSRCFLQALEGDRTLLSRLYNRMVVDPRHTSLVILGMEPIERRVFAQWQMGYAAADASRKPLYLRHGSSSNFEPRRLTAPGALALLQDFAQLDEAVSA